MLSMGVWSLRRSIGLSIVLHALFLLACALLLVQQPTQRTPRNLTWIEMMPPQSVKKPAKTVPLPDLEKKKQVVVTEKGRSVDQPTKDAFLGERNQVVSEQTVGRKQEFGSSRPVPRESPRARTREAVNEIGKLAMPLLPHLKERERVNAETERNWASEGQVVQDYVKGLKQSDRTALNTREYVFFGYFQRIRERLDRAWIPILKEKLAKYYYSGRKLATDMDHSTQILVVLNQSGEITKVQVTSASGTQDLDEAAIKAFNEAGPFPHPPRGIVDQNGEIKIPWEFILRT